MAKRKFRLPNVQELSKEQDKVLRLPLDGQFLIVGGPGTGKSVVALLRAIKIKQDCDFLTYNKVLCKATTQLSDSVSNNTLDSWFGKKYWSIFKKYAPQISPHNPNYDEILSELEKLELSDPKYLIIDEGQDKPSKFYDVIIDGFGIRNIFIVADQNQQITEDNSTRQELTDLLNLDIGDVIELRENYRNSYHIANFCRHFYTDISSPPPNLPNRESIYIPVLYEYNDLQESLKMAILEADKDNRSLIGIIVAKDDMRINIVERLKSLDLKLDNPKPIISTYSSKDKSVNIDFTDGGIVVLSDKSIKGLEFDIVFIIIDGFVIYNNDIDSMKKRFYVMSSRAKEKLILLKSVDYYSGVDKILPTDTNILKRDSSVN